MFKVIRPLTIILIATMISCGGSNSNESQVNTSSNNSPNTTTSSSEEKKLLEAENKCQGQENVEVCGFVIVETDQKCVPVSIYDNTCYDYNNQLKEEWRTFKSPCVALEMNASYVYRSNGANCEDNNNYNYY